MKLAIITFNGCKEISYEVIHNQYKNHVHAALNTSTNFSIHERRHDCMRVIIQEMNSSLVIPSLQIVNQSHRAANHLTPHT